jgi:hypothetical protein
VPNEANFNKEPSWIPDWLISPFCNVSDLTAYSSPNASKDSVVEASIQDEVLTYSVFCIGKVSKVGVQCSEFTLEMFRRGMSDWSSLRPLLESFRYCQDIIGSDIAENEGSTHLLGWLSVFFSGQANVLVLKVFLRLWKTIMPEYDIDQICCSQARPKL